MLLKVNEVKKVELPELNDDFAKEIGEFDSLKALKDEIKKALMHRSHKEIEVRSNLLFYRK